VKSTKLFDNVFTFAFQITRQLLPAANEDDSIQIEKQEIHVAAHCRTVSDANGF